ncbi:MAG: glycosyltransferase family 39 protein [Candidatus Roizmanbacteria bacterium]
MSSEKRTLKNNSTTSSKNMKNTRFNVLSSMSTIFKNTISWIRLNPYTFVFILFLFIVFSILRFYRFYEFVTFLGDQGRDAIIVKRIAMFEKFAAIGPPSSIGQVFLGPFFYYLMAPFLLIARFNPVGMGIGVAVMSLAGLLYCVLVIRNTINIQTALIFAMFVGFSFIQIELARFAWNPNLLPLASFLTLYSFYLVLKHQSIKHSFIFGLLIGIIFQFHHLAFLLMPVILLFSVKHVWLERKHYTHYLKIIGSAFVAYVIVSLPIILFDIKNKFINSKSFFNVFTQKDLVSDESYSGRFVSTVQTFIHHTLQYDMSPQISLIIFFLIICTAFYLIMKYKPHILVSLCTVHVLLYILFFSLLSSPRYPHYYAPVYYAFYFIVAYIFATLLQKSKLTYIFLVLFFSIYVYTNSQEYFFITHYGNNQITKAREIAESILPNVNKIPFQIVSIPSTETDGHVRYFLETGGKTPLPEESAQQPEIIIVLCYEKECQVVANPQWQLASFSNGKVEKKWKYDNITIYKVIHDK